MGDTYLLSRGQQQVDYSEGCCQQSKMMNKINHPSKFIKSKYKVAVVGPYAAGKTSLIMRFGSGSFEENYHMTLRPSSYSKVVRLEDSLQVRLQLIDTLGSGVSPHDPHSQLREIDAILLVYDVTNEQSFFKLGDLLSELKPSLSKETLLALVGTHYDRPHLREVTPQESRQLKKQYGVSLFYEVSAKTNENVTELFHDLAKYLLIVGASREKEENPEASTTFEEERLVAVRSAKSAVLQKKLAYKQEECRKLWKDYEDAMERISHLQLRVKDDSSYILNYAGDTQQLQTKIQHLEQQIQQKKAQFISEKMDLEQEYRFALRNERQRLQIAQQQNQQLKYQLQKMTSQLTYIQTIFQEHELNNKSLLQQIRTEIEALKSEILVLSDEKTALTQVLQEEICEKTTIKCELERKIAQLQAQIVEKNNQISALALQKQHLLYLKEQSQKILQSYQLKMIAYREQMVEMHYLQDELAIQHEKYYRMEIAYQDSMAKVKCEYEARIDSLRREKEIILQQKEKVVSKIISNKVDQIKLIRSFIGEMDSKKQQAASPLVSSTLETQKSQTDIKVRQFFNQFIELIQQNSQYLHYNLQALLGSIESVQAECEQLIENTAKLDLSEVWYDLKQREQNSYLAALIQKPEAHQIWCILNLQTQKRVSKCASLLESMMDKVSEATSELRTNLSHITDSLQKVGKIRQIGLQAYVQTLGY